MARTLGIDTSHWDGHVDFTKAKAAGAFYAFLKASQWVQDPLFAEGWKNAKAAGLLRGAYHYLDWGWSEVSQAALFCKILKADVGELPPVLDLEQDPAPFGLTPAQVYARVTKFLTIVQATLGRVPMLYTGYYYWNYYGKNDPAMLKYPFWLPWYSPEWYIKLRTGGGTGAPKPWLRWKFWQYTDQGDGVKYGCQSKSVDLNWFDGSVEELYAFASSTPVPPPPPSQSGSYKVNVGSLKVFAGPGDMYKQVALPLTLGTIVTVLETVTSNGEQWSKIASPAGWVRAVYLIPA